VYSSTSDAINKKGAVTKIDAIEYDKPLIYRRRIMIQMEEIIPVIKAMKEQINARKIKCPISIPIATNPAKRITKKIVKPDRIRENTASLFVVF
jgi:hypothetical protein